MLRDKNFAPLEHSIKDLVEYSKMILETSQFCRINFPGKVVRKMVNLLSDNYNTVAYHNFTHAFSLFLVKIILT